MPPQMHGCVRTAYWVVAQDVDRPERRRVLVAVLVDRDANRWKRLSTDDWSILERVTHYKRFIIPELPEAVAVSCLEKPATITVEKGMP
jgi:hypothetical protein